MIRGQTDSKSRTCTQFALDTDKAAVGLDEVMGNRQPKPRSAGMPGAGFFNAIETIEKVGKLLLGYTEAGVYNGDTCIDRFPVNDLFFYFNRNCSSTRGVTDRIALLLIAYLRTLIATVYLILTVLLSYLSALGLGWLVLHHFLGVDAIQGTIPLYAFVFLVALGEDYNIFVVSAIWKKASACC